MIGSIYLDDLIVTSLLTAASWTPPTSIYMGLHTSAGATMVAADWHSTEVTAAGYARTLIPGSSWGAASNGSMVNSTAVTFPSAGADWGTITHMSLWDSADAGATPVVGNLLLAAALTTAISVLNGDQPVFASGKLTVGLL